MYKVVIERAFEDKYTGEKYLVGDTLTMPKERVAEIMATSNKLITVVGEVEEVPEAPVVEEVPEAPKPKSKSKKKS